MSAVLDRIGFRGMPGKCTCRAVYSAENVPSKPRPLGEGGYRTQGDGRAIRLAWSARLVATGS
jgi:hypothetical protein